jgi:hypothetical protein
VLILAGTRKGLGQCVHSCSCTRAAGAPPAARDVYVEGEDLRERDGLGTALGEIETVRIVAAIAGG